MWKSVFSRKLQLLLFLVCFIPLGALAQTVKGTVSDEAGEPIIGASVKVVGTGTGSVTDVNGQFSVNAASNARLAISYVGYITEEVSVAGRQNVDVVLKEDNTTLNDVVVVGYGTMKKKLVTGATVQVKGEDIAKLNTTNALEAMQSSTPGVQITQGSAQPGKGYKVYIRGIGTIGNSAPLYVIDGVAGGSLDDINPADIESIDVLKDAASAAIYGARAANGVILVTTRQGKAGKVEITYNGAIGWSNAYKRPQLLNAQHDKWNRAMAGLSMGGMETKTITLRRPEVFGSYGLLSGGQYEPSDIKDKKQVKLIFESCGSKEQPDRINESVKNLKAAGFNAHGYISEGTAHE